MAGEVDGVLRMWQAAVRGGGEPTVDSRGSQTRAVMEGSAARRVIKEVRGIKTGIAGQVSEVVAWATGGYILVREGKVELYSRGWGPLGGTSVS